MPTDDAPWLPDLCRLPRLLAVLFATEMIVIAVALASAPDQGDHAARFVSGSAFALWTALVSSVALCQSRRWLSRRPRWLGTALALALPMLVAAGFAWAVDELAAGGLLPVAASVRGPSGVLGIAVLAGLLAACVLRYFYVLDQWSAQVEASARASLDALQARIRPHFLFNSLNTIASLVRIDPVRAERAVENLADLFRAALSAGERDSTLGEELELCRRYLAIEALRYGDRLAVDWRIDDAVPQEHRMPSLLVQPLVENAVNHGIAQLPKGGTIAIEATLAGDAIELRITNPVLAGRSASRNGHALRSISQRLAYYYRSSAARLDTEVAGDAYTCVLRLPLAGPSHPR
jgi:two-component system sensor histidine kinase AlgZ